MIHNTALDDIKEKQEKEEEKLRYACPEIHPVVSGVLEGLV